jgi:vacuolar protein sorting-associated protein 51
MKGNVDSMEEEMNSLTKSMEEITIISDTINNNLYEKRDKIEKLSSVNLMLKRLQFITELPSKLNSCLESKSYTVAVDYYTKAEVMLRQYSKYPGNF